MLARSLAAGVRGMVRTAADPGGGSRTSAADGRGRPAGTRGHGCLARALARHQGGDVAFGRRRSRAAGSAVALKARFRAGAAPEPRGAGTLVLASFGR